MDHGNFGKAESWIFRSMLSSQLYFIVDRSLRLRTGSSKNVWRADTLGSCFIKAKHIKWRQYPTQQLVYGDLPPVSAVSAQFAQLCTTFASHCMTAFEQTISTVLPWWIQQPHCGGKLLTYLDTACRNVGLELGNLIWGDQYKTGMFGETCWTGFRSKIAKRK